jgi:hypothetical protein
MGFDRYYAVLHQECRVSTERRFHNERKIEGALRTPVHRSAFGKGPEGTGVSG